MKKKILIGSIIAICILVGVSFTSVVGYRSIASNVNASPLFNIRSSRAIDDESNELTYNYVGKEKQSILSIPKRDISKLYIKDVIKIFYEMDDISYTRFIDLFIKRMYKDKLILKSDIPFMMMYLHQLKTTPDGVKNELSDSMNKIWTLDKGEKCFFTLGNPRKLWCLLLNILLQVGAFLFFLPFVILAYLIHGEWPTHVSYPNC
jgi:hypothetical protein